MRALVNKVYSAFYLPGHQNVPQSSKPPSNSPSWWSSTPLTYMISLILSHSLFMYLLHWWNILTFVLCGLIWTPKTSSTMPYCFSVAVFVFFSSDIDPRLVLGTQQIPNLPACLQVLTNNGFLHQGHSSSSRLNTFCPKKTGKGSQLKERSIYGSCLLWVSREEKICTPGCISSPRSPSVSLSSLALAPSGPN